MLNGASARFAGGSTALVCRSHAVSEVMNARLPTVLLVALKVTALSKVDLSLDNVASAASAQRVSQFDHTGPHCANAAPQPGYQTRQSILTEMLIQVHASWKLGLAEEYLIETMTSQSQLFKTTVVSSNGALFQIIPARGFLI